MRNNFSSFRSQYTYPVKKLFDLFEESSKFPITLLIDVDLKSQQFISLSL